MTSPPGKQAMATYILLNISRSSGNQTIKSGQLMKYNMRNIFLERSNTKCGGETTPIRFSKKSNLGYLWVNNFKVNTTCIYSMTS